MNAKYESYRLNPETAGLLQARARRARAQAIHNLVVRFLQWLADRVGSKGGHPFSVRWG